MKPKNVGNSQVAGDLKDLDADFDGMSNNSGYAEWLYNGPNTTTGQSSSEKVQIISASDRDRFDSDKKRAKGVILIPKLDFGRIDPHRQFPKENSQNSDIKKKFEGIMNDEELNNKKLHKSAIQLASNSPPNLTKAKLSTNNLNKKSTKELRESNLQHQSSVLNNNEAASPGNDNIRRKDRQPMQSVINDSGSNSNAPFAKRTEAVTSSRKLLDLQNPGFWSWFSIILMLISVLMDFLSFNRGFDALLATIEKITNAVVGTGNIGTIFLYAIINTTMDILILPGITSFKVLIAAKLDNFWGPFFVILTWNCIWGNMLLYIVPKLKISKRACEVFEYQSIGKSFQILFKDHKLFEAVIFASTLPVMLVIIIGSITRAKDLKDKYHWIWFNFFSLLHSLYNALPGTRGIESQAAFLGRINLFDGGAGCILFLVWQYLRFLVFIIIIIILVRKVIQINSPKASIKPMIQSIRQPSANLNGINKIIKKPIDDSSEQSILPH